MKQKLFFIISAIEKEKFILLNNVKILISNLQKSSIYHYRIAIIYQNNKKIDEDILFLEKFDRKIEVYFVDFFSLSKSRNMGISKINTDDDYICFLDVRINLSLSFLMNSKNLMKENCNLWCGRLKYDNYIENKDKDRKEYRKSTYFPYWKILSFPSVSTYMIRKDLIKGISFNETIGMSKDNKLKGGEDIVFWHDVIIKNKIKKVVYLEKCFVYHPKRIKYDPKILIYTEATGAVLYYLINRKMPAKMKIYVVFYLILFVGNGFFRILSLQKNSVEIFKKKISGLLKNRIIHEISDAPVRKY